MKHPVKLVATLLAIGLPLTAQAYCDRYPNSTLTLNMPATIIVPDSLANGSLITSQAFSGTAPDFIANCPSAVYRWFVGRYPNDRFPGSQIYRTEVPGIGVRVSMTWAGGTGSPYFAIHDTPPHQVYGKIPSFTSATAHFYKMAPVTTGTIPSGDIWTYRWVTTSEKFVLTMGNSVRFVRPAATCDLAAGDVNRTIALPIVQKSVIETSGTAGTTNFELTANCTGASSVTYRFSGTPEPLDPWRFANTGSAAGVSLWLFSRVGGPAKTIRADGTDSARTVTVSGNKAILPLGAAYFKTGTVGQGTLVSSATVNITYN